MSLRFLADLFASGKTAARIIAMIAGFIP